MPIENSFQQLMQNFMWNMGVILVTHLGDFPWHLWFNFPFGCKIDCHYLIKNTYCKYCVKKWSKNWSGTPMTLMICFGLSRKQSNYLSCNMPFKFQRLYLLFKYVWKFSDQNYRGSRKTPMFSTWCDCMKLLQEFPLINCTTQNQIHWCLLILYICVPVHAST